MRFPLSVLLLGLSISTTAEAGPLGDAAKNGDVEEIKRLLAEGVNANEENALATPLHFAAMNGHSEAVTLLASHGAELDATSAVGSPLHAAAQFGRLETVRALLAAGANPDVRDRDQFTPLLRAVYKNQVSIVEALLDGGADVDAIGDSPGPGGDIGWGPTIALQLARRNGHFDIEELLLAAGAGPIPPEVPANIETLGDPQRGRDLSYTFCSECHVIEAGEEEIIGTAGGPSLIGVIGRDVASDDEFGYTAALVTYGGTWTPDRFFPFILRPTLTAPGTRMNVRSLEPSPDEAADITSYFVSVAR